MVSDEALKKLQEQIAAWPMTQRFVVQQLIEDYRKNREDLRAYKATGLTPEEVLPKDKADEIALKLMRLADLENFCSYTRLCELAEADKESRLFLLPLEPGRSMLCREHFERPWVMKNVAPCVQYQSSGGIVFYMGYDVFRGLVEHGKITPLSPEGEKALEAMKDVCP